MKFSQVGIGLMVWFSVCAPVQAGERLQSANVTEREASTVRQVMVQIGGRR